jgi:hypothetical protein
MTQEELQNGMGTLPVEVRSPDGTLLNPALYFSDPREDK